MPNLNDLIGKPFLLGARGPDQYDCHGLAIEVFRRFGVDFADMDYRELNTPEKVNEEFRRLIERHISEGSWAQILKPIEPCAVVLRNQFKLANHLGVYIGSGKFIHAFATVDEKGEMRGQVCVNRLSDPLWRNRIVGYYKHIGGREL